MTEPTAFDARSLLGALIDHGVRFVVIGGLAVGAHGHPRATKDIDIVPDPEPENLERLAGLLKHLDCTIVGSEELDPEELVQPDAQGLIDGGSWVLQTRFGRLDILQHVPPGFEYADLDSEAIEDVVFGARVRFCGYSHLVAMKEAAGRDQDIVDLRRLREIRAED